MAHEGLVQVHKFLVEADKILASICNNLTDLRDFRNPDDPHHAIYEKTYDLMLKVDAAIGDLLESAGS